MDLELLLSKLRQGLSTLPVGQQYQEQAMANIATWLQDSQYRDYQEQILDLINKGNYALLLDAFYQVIPFGTGGRRGPVGIGPNRINPWTIQASAQGHSQYLLDQFGDQACQRGIVICYDVRTYPDTGLYSPDLPNPVKGITSRDFALHAACVYAANGIKCYLFPQIRSTPQLSFAIRYLQAVAGIMISASHNPKEDNGKKVYTAHGGQLIPPQDQQLATMVNKVSHIKKISAEQARSSGLLCEDFHAPVDQAYLEAIQALSLIPRAHPELKIIYSPLHGVGHTSVYQSLQKRDWQVFLDEATATPDGTFPNVKFNIPNPEVPQSMDTLVMQGRRQDADLLISSDPDADRLGLMVKIAGQGSEATYRYCNGNEIGVLLTHFVLAQRAAQQTLRPDSLIIKTAVTTELITKIAAHYQVQVIGDLLVGFKYIAHAIHQLEEQGALERFILGLEESHGFLIGTYTRDKDAAGAALLLCELASQLKSQGRHLIDYLDEIYQQYGYHCQQQSSLIFLGAAGKEKIDRIVAQLRAAPPDKVGEFKVQSWVDRQQGPPLLSETDKSARNMLICELAPPTGVAFMKIAIRPSGTEPKIKIYVEVGALPADQIPEKLSNAQVQELTTAVIDSFTQQAYRILNINMPPRGLRLSPLLPVEQKLAYFAMEDQLWHLLTETRAGKISTNSAREQLAQYLQPFGQDPVDKINPAFQQRFGCSLGELLEELQLT